MGNHGVDGNGFLRIYPEFEGSRHGSPRPGTNPAPTRRSRALTRASRATQSRLRRPTLPMFSKGQKVVCINDDFPPEAAVLFAELPKKDQVYTVRGMYIGRGNYFRHESGKKDGEIGLLLEEILNPRDPALKTGLNGELGFNSERFAPLETDQDEATAEEEAEFSLPTAAA